MDVGGAVDPIHIHFVYLFGRKVFRKFSEKALRGSGDSDDRTRAFAIPVAGFREWGTPAIKPFGILVAHVDTAVTHHMAEIVVPVSPVECHAVFMEERHPGHTDQFISIQIG